MKNKYELFQIMIIMIMIIIRKNEMRFIISIVEYHVLAYTNRIFY